MPRKRARSLRCPTCRKLVVREEPEFPFCSERCRLIDLGKWASGGYVISTPVDQADQFGETDYTVTRASTARTGGATQHDGQDRKPS
jgi:endogenous inhibitor of DNA gyrase (YacG/DUF329 family)